MWVQSYINLSFDERSADDREMIEVCRSSYFYMYLKQCNLCVYMSSGHDRNQTRQRSVTHLSLSCSLKLWTESAVIEAPQGKPTGLGLRRHTWQKHTWSAAHHSLTNESWRSDSFVWVCSSKHHNITWIQETGLGLVSKVKYGLLLSYLCWLILLFRN